MITLKHLAREYDIDPYKLRQFLRTHFGIRRRWRWNEEDPQDIKDLQMVRTSIEKHHGA